MFSIRRIIFAGKSCYTLVNSKKVKKLFSAVKNFLIGSSFGRIFMFLSLLLLSAFPDLPKPLEFISY